MVAELSKFARRAVAKRLGVSVKTIDRLAEQGRLRKLRLSKRTVVIDPESVRDLLGDKLYAELFTDSPALPRAGDKEQRGKEVAMEQSVWTVEEWHQAIADGGNHVVLALERIVDEDGLHYKVIHDELGVSGYHAYDPDHPEFKLIKWAVYRVDLMLELPYLVYFSGRWYAARSTVDGLVRWWSLPRWVCPTIPYRLCKRLNEDIGGE